MKKNFFLPVARPFCGIPFLGKHTGPLLGPPVFQDNHELLERVDSSAVGWWVFCLVRRINDGLLYRCSSNLDPICCLVERLFLSLSLSCKDMADKCLQRELYQKVNKEVDIHNHH